MRYFEKDEFDNFEKMDKAFLNILDEIRHISGNIIHSS